MTIKELIDVLSKLPGKSIVSVDDISNGGVCNADLVMKADGTILLTSGHNLNAYTGMNDDEMRKHKDTLFYRPEH